jgi:hypothetical protein
MAKHLSLELLTFTKSVRTSVVATRSGGAPNFGLLDMVRM